jgi:hypothetical protein
VNSPTPILKTISYAAGGRERSRTQIEDFMQEVIGARIYGGVNYRNSGDVGAAMGKQIGSLAIKKYLKTP